MKRYKSEKARQNILRTYDLILAQWGVDLTERDLPGDFGTTHVICWGNREAPPLLLFHGVGDDSALMWLDNAKALSEHFFLYAVDTIGGPGKSVPSDSYFRAFDDVRWLQQLLDGLELDRFFVAGVSNGAYLTQLVCRAFPDRAVKGVALAGTVPAGQPGGHWSVMMKIFLPEALFPTRRNMIRLIGKLTGENGARLVENELFMEHYTWLLKGFNPMAMSFHKIEPFTDEQIDALRSKVFYLMGEEDPFARLGGKERLIQHGMNARFFARTGHAINQERAREVETALIGFLLGDTGPA